MCWEIERQMKSLDEARKSKTTTTDASAGWDHTWCSVYLLAYYALSAFTFILVGFVRCCWRRRKSGYLL
jgi:hypothetical protein